MGLWIIPALLTLAAMIVFTLYWAKPAGRCGRLPVTVDETGEVVDEKRFLGCRVHPMERRDALPLILITALYGVVAFIGLGSRSAPESFALFETPGQIAVVELSEPEFVSEVWYYTGIKSGTYTMETSVDGENWAGPVELKQEYSEQLRWLKFTDSTKYCQKVRLTSLDGPLYLGELALFDMDGNLLPVQGDGLGAKLVDDQSAVPASPSYMNSSYFDEIYHVRTAWEHILNIWPYEVSHPPLGKLIISVGVSLLGLNPFGWRFMGVLFGILMLPALYILLKNMFGKTVVAACGTLVFAFDFMHFVQTRIATIDTYGVFFILLMYLFMYRYFAQEPDAPLKKTLPPLLLSGLCFGLGAASKWIVFYGGAGLAVLWLIRQIGRGVYCRRRGIRGFGAYLTGTVAASVLFFMVIPAVIYLLSYLPYGSAEGVKPFSQQYLKIVWDNQKFMFGYHSKLVATHPYSSPWWQWVLDGRPILYYLEYQENDMKSAFGAFGNPLVWWTGILAIIAAVINLIRRKSGTALFIIVAYMAQLLPWIFVTRICFIYHYFPSSLFIAVAIAMMMNDIVEAQRSRGKWACVAFTVGCIALFIMFYPVLTGVSASSAYTGNWLRWFAGSYPF